jgi:diguanylate cyclase (GGDEF)-like protein/PAS domain S-box-containing protein
VYFVDTGRKITYWNKAAERLTGFKAEDVIGRQCADNVLNHCDKHGTELCVNGCPLSATIKNGGLQEAEVFLHHARGHRVPVWVRASPIIDADGTIIGAVEVFNSNLKNIQARWQVQVLEQKIFTDSLTGLGNREYLEQQFRTALFHLETMQAGHSLIFIDIDDFRNVNDQYGHIVGDQVLKMLANTLRSNLQAADVVARWGGDEFVVLLNAITPNEAEQIVEKLHALIERSHFYSKTGEVSVTVSVGMTMLRLGDRIEDAIERADLALLKNKWQNKQARDENVQTSLPAR